MQSAWQERSERGPSRLAVLLPIHLLFHEVFMIDPKQGPMSRTRRKAELSVPSHRHAAKRAPADAAPEPERTGKRPSAAKRQFSVVGS